MAQSHDISLPRKVLKFSIKMSFKLSNCSWYEFEHNSSQIYSKLQDSEELRWFWWGNFLNVSLTFRLAQAGTLQLHSSGSTLRKRRVIGDLQVKWPVKSNDTWFFYLVSKNATTKLCLFQNVQWSFNLSSITMAFVMRFAFQTLWQGNFYFLDKNFFLIFRIVHMKAL